MTVEFNNTIDLLEELRPAWMKESEIYPISKAIYLPVVDSDVDVNPALRFAATVDGLVGYPDVFGQCYRDLVLNTVNAFDVEQSSALFDDAPDLRLPNSYPGLLIKRDGWIRNGMGTAVPTLLVLGALPEVVELETEHYIIEPTKVYWAIENISYPNPQGILVIEHVTGTTYDDADSNIQSAIRRAVWDVGEVYKSYGINVWADINNYDVICRRIDPESGKPVLALIDLDDDTGNENVYNGLKVKK